MALTALVVDDSRVSRMIISAMIQDLRPGAWSVEEAADGAEAIAKADACKPDLVTLDINMPVMNGFDAAVEIRARHPFATLVIFSANVQASSKARAEELGIRFIAKPITEAVVRQALEAWEAEHG
jgi:CheY-like chemotaxis protein